MRISDIYQSIIAAYNDWGARFLGNPRFIQTDHEITWHNRQTGLPKSIVRESHVIEMADAGQYTFQIVDDGGLLQLYYRFNYRKDELEVANLAFYRAKPHRDYADEDTLLYEMGVMPIDDKEVSAEQETNLTVLRSILDQPAGWLRIDYDPAAKERGIIHHDCHMHLSSFPHTRFIVSGIPMPRQFIEFIIASMYPNRYKKHCLKLETDEDKNTKIWQYTDTRRIQSVNSLCLPLAESSIYNQLSHFRIPSS